MSIDALLKGAGKMAKTLTKETADPNVRGIFRRAKKAEMIYQNAVPWHLRKGVAVPLVAGGVAVMGGIAGAKAHNQAKLGTVTSGEGLANMTEGTIANASANVISPLLKEMQDNSTASARQRSAEIRDSIGYNIDASGADGDIVFALHNMR